MLARDFGFGALPVRGDTIGAKSTTTDTMTSATVDTKASKLSTQPVSTLPLAPPPPAAPKKDEVVYVDPKASTAGTEPNALPQVQTEPAAPTVDPRDAVKQAMHGDKTPLPTGGGGTPTASDAGGVTSSTPPTMYEQALALGAQAGKSKEEVDAILWDLGVKTEADITLAVLEALTMRLAAPTPKTNTSTGGGGMGVGLLVAAAAGAWLLMRKR